MDADIAQALRRHHSELRQMCPQRINQHRALAHQLLAATMQQRRRLLAHASNPTTQRGSRLKNASTCPPRRMARFEPAIIGE
jgi:hypothetical protein